VRRLTISAAFVCVLVFSVLLWKPLASRGQVGSSPSNRIISSVNASHVVNAVSVRAAQRVVEAASQSIATDAVNASLFDPDGRTLPPKLAAAGYPLPERKYIRSGLWEVGTTELGVQYHTFDCPHMKRTSRNYIYGFPTWREALVAGYQPDINCTPAPLIELIRLTRVARREVTERGQPPSAVTDTKLSEIRTDAGAESVSEKVLNRVFSRMLGRAVALPPPATAPQQQQGSGQLGFGAGGPSGGMDEGLPPGMPGGFSGSAMGGPGGRMGGMGGMMDR
jgi:hypothetical protein